MQRIYIVGCMGMSQTALYNVGAETTAPGACKQRIACKILSLSYQSLNSVSALQYTPEEHVESEPAPSAALK